MALILLALQWLFDKEKVQLSSQVKALSLWFQQYLSCQISNLNLVIFAANWWAAHGTDAKELRKMAIKILNLTCSSSACERNWSAFERVRTSLTLCTTFSCSVLCFLDLNGCFIVGPYQEKDEINTEEIELSCLCHV